jgi:hypothetical protein
VNLRVSPEEKAEMARTAESFGKSLSEYFVTLHRLTVAIQGSRKDRRSPVRGIPKGKTS